MPDESSLPFFDRTATAAGGFPVARRGYDKQAVDDYVRALEMQLHEARARAEQFAQSVTPLQQQLEEAKRQLDASANPSYAGLGDRAAQILRLAQDQASEALEEARREADELRSTAAKESAASRAAAEREAEDIRTVALTEADSLRRTAEGDAAEIRRTAETEATELLTAARRKAEQLQLTAESQASTLKNGALHEAEKIRTAIQRESAALRARLADEREQQAKELADKHNQIAADTENLTVQMKEAAEASERRVAEATEQARKIRAEAEESAERTITRARREAEQVLTSARTRADAELASAADEAERSRALVARETERLAKRRDGILAQIAGLNEIAGNIARQAAELDSETAAPPFVNPFAQRQERPRFAGKAEAGPGSTDAGYDRPAGDEVATEGPGTPVGGADSPFKATTESPFEPGQSPFAGPGAGQASPFAGAESPFAGAGDESSAAGAGQVRSPFAPEGGPFTGSSPFIGTDAGQARVDQTTIDPGLRITDRPETDGGAAAGEVDPDDATVVVERPDGTTAGGPADNWSGEPAGTTEGATGTGDADDEPHDATKIDEFRLDDLASEQTRVDAVPAGAAENEKTNEADTGSRSRKDTR